MIVLYGHGYVGEYIAKELKEKKFKFVHLSHKDALPAEVKFIINAAGYTGLPNVDACEKFKDECIDGNVLWPLALEKKTKMPILHITSGCVYTGYEKFFTEEDAPNFTFSNGSFYSGCKALAQELLKPYLSKSYLFRIRMPFGPDVHQKNLLTKYERYDKLVNFENSVTQVEDLAKCVCHFIDYRPQFGIYNVCNPGSTDAKAITQAMGLEKEFMTHEEFFSAVVAPRSNCVLDTKKLENVYKMPSVEEALSKTIKQYKGI